MKRALILLKPSPHYRREAFEAGLKACGFTLVRRLDDPRPGDVLVVWNLCGGNEKLADTFKRRGAQVIVTENGYLTPTGKPGMYAVSLGAHNGAGTFPACGPERWQALGVTPKPWRKDGDHILVCQQRGIGSRAMASPHMWHQKAVERLKRWTKRPIKVRPHPGNRSSAVPIEHDLKGAWACVIWGSAAGVRALVEGVPVFYDAPKWICSEAALPLRDWIEHPLCNDAWREKALASMAWGQWRYDEIATGEPLRRVLNDTDRQV